MSHGNGGGPKFKLGRVVITRTAKAVLLEEDVLKSLDRHHHGDWGTLDPEDWQANEDALRNGDRLLSVYNSRGVKFYVITEWDRSYTTVLLPVDY